MFGGQSKGLKLTRRLTGGSIKSSIKKSNALRT